MFQPVCRSHCQDATRARHASTQYERCQACKSSQYYLASKEAIKASTERKSKSEDKPKPKPEQNFKKLLRDVFIPLHYLFLLLAAGICLAASSWRQLEFPVIQRAHPETSHGHEPENHPSTASNGADGNPFGTEKWVALSPP